MNRVRLTLGRLMLAVLAAGLAIGGALAGGIVLARRPRLPAPPPCPPWRAVPAIAHDHVLFINEDDERRGIDPPRMISIPVESHAGRPGWLEDPFGWWRYYFERIYPRWLRPPPVRRDTSPRPRHEEGRTCDYVSRWVA